MKSVLTVVLLLVLSFSFAFGDEICDEADQIWSVLTDSKPVPSSSYWLLHNGLIVRKDVLEEQQQLAYGYLLDWKAYEEIAISESGIMTLHSPESVSLGKTDAPLSVNISQLAQNESEHEETTSTVNDHPPSWEELSLPQKPEKEYVSLKVFHWHLSADTHSEDSVKRMNLLLNNIKRHLTAEKLAPDIFAFTGTHIITGKETQDLLPEYAENLCKVLWKYRFNKKPGTEECQMKRPDLEKKAMGKHNIFWTEHMLVISMLPAKPLTLPRYGDYENCVMYVDEEYPISSYLFLDVQYGDNIIPTMFFSTLDESVMDMVIIPDNWQYCSTDLKQDTDITLAPSETMVIVSHINTPYFTYRDFATHWSAWVRNTEGNTKELPPKLARLFFRHYRRTDDKARRFSAVLSYRRARMNMVQPTRAHMAPDDMYLEPPGTLQKYFKWQGYSFFKPSYTEIQLDKDHLSEMQ